MSRNIQMNINNDVGTRNTNNSNHNTHQQDVQTSSNNKFPSYQNNQSRNENNNKSFQSFYAPNTQAQNSQNFDSGKMKTTNQDLSTAHQTDPSNLTQNECSQSNYSRISEWYMFSIVNKLANNNQMIPLKSE